MSTLKKSRGVKYNLQPRKICIRAVCRKTKGFLEWLCSAVRLCLLSLARTHECLGLCVSGHLAGGTGSGFCSPFAPCSADTCIFLSLEV